LLKSPEEVKMTRDYGCHLIDFQRAAPLPMAFRIEYAPATQQHLSELTARQQKIVVDAVDRQLAHEPHIETRNRKPLRANPIAPWELRIDNFRVY
jgi:mRNA-degrading endonuclease RelE of RelBE toxin-antitoxin system